jgi:hypothetical protein
MHHDAPALCQQINDRDRIVWIKRHVGTLEVSNHGQSQLLYQDRDQIKDIAWQNTADTRGSNDAHAEPFLLQPVNQVADIKRHAAVQKASDKIVDEDMQIRPPSGQVPGKASSHQQNIEGPPRRATKVCRQP